MPDAKIQRRRHVAICLFVVLDPVTIGPSHGLSSPVVRRAIVDNDDLDVGIGLRKCALYRCSKVVGPVVDRNDD